MVDLASAGEAVAAVEALVVLQVAQLADQPFGATVPQLCNSSGVRVATWNLQWASPRGARHAAIRQQLEGVAADVVVATECFRSDWAVCPHVVDAGHDWGYPIVEGQRKVVAWSRTPWADARTVDHGATQGRLVMARTPVDGVDVHVIAVCIPWAAAHVSTGRRDRKRWDEHLEFCATLAEVLREAPPHTVVVGDFNQAIPRRRQPVRVLDALIDALGGYRVTTAGDTAVGPLIDHVALGPGLVETSRIVWPNTIDGVVVSDHTGVAVDIARA